MADLKQILAVSSSGMEAQSGRLRNISQNIANADTPGYRRKTAAFEAEMRGAEARQVHLSRTRLDRSELQRIHDPAHPMADASGYYDGSNVDLMVEIADAREAQRSYEANLRMFDQARQMTSAALDLLRR
ncbi:flagellar basal body rod protein FlgC [Haematobacter massiliensis]|uniref:flagellar basal body rod protein FlgC n=1 Tax=Haematobacter massiliensis TaxID=195105 RepID=UPI0023F1C43F|nr:flagellar basal body rod protein FlgC [Haematobacter massiliensis]